MIPALLNRTVDGAQLAHGGLHHPLDGGPVGHVHGEAEGAPPARLDGPHRFGELGLAHVGERDVRTLRRHPLRDGPPDTPRRARHQYGPAFETHWISPFDGFLVCAPMRPACASGETRPARLPAAGRLATLCHRPGRPWSGRDRTR